MACGFGVCLGCVVPSPPEGEPASSGCAWKDRSARGAAGVVTDLSVDVGAFPSRIRVLTASGTFGYGLEFTPFLDLSALGGLVTKGLSPRPRRGTPPPRIAETPSGMLC